MKSEIEKKLDALIDALEFDVEISNTEVVNTENIFSGRAGVACGVITENKTVQDFKLIKKDLYVPIKVQSKEWGCIVDFVFKYREEIIADFNGYGDLSPILEFINRNTN